MIPTFLGCLVWVKAAFSHLRFKEYKFKDNPKPNIQVIGVRVYQSLLAFKKKTGEKRTSIPRLLSFPFELSILSWNWYTKTNDTPYSSGSNLTVSQCFDQPPSFPGKNPIVSPIFSESTSGHLGMRTLQAPAQAVRLHLRAQQTPGLRPALGPMWVAFCRPIDIYHIKSFGKHVFLHIGQ